MNTPSCRPRSRDRRTRAVARARRPHRDADAQPAAGAQQPVGGAAAALSDDLAAIAADRSVRAVVLAANGPAFCAGHDLKELTARRSDADGGRDYFEHYHDDLQRHDAADRRPAPAGDRRGARRRHAPPAASWSRAAIWPLPRAAAFATPGVNIGLFCSTPMVALSRNVARKQAMEMLLTGDLIAADDAAAHRPGQPRGRGRRASATRRSRSRKQIAAKSSYVLGIGKQAFYRQIEMPLAEAYRLRLRGDDREHDGARRRGRHRRLHREARADLGRPLIGLWR